MASSIYELTHRARRLGLSFPQMGALDWLAAQRAPVFTRDYRRADIRYTTLVSLKTRGLVNHGSDACGIFWFVTDAGRAAASDGVAELAPADEPKKDADGPSLP